MTRVERELTATGDYQSVVTPLTILDFARATIEQRIASQPQKLQHDHRYGGRRRARRVGWPR